MNQASIDKNQDSEKDGRPLHELMSLSADSAQKLKRGAISHACQEKDIKRLIGLADSAGGLLDDSLRRKACEHSSQFLSEFSTNID